MEYTIIIGLEVHVQLLTKSKIFCGCANLFNPSNPNVQTCPVCLGLPGSLPVMNREAFELAVKTALALNCQIAPYTKWDRKHYYYPDLPKGYQISQYDLPLSHDGWVDVIVNPATGETRRVGIIRAHLEEDAGKNMHDETGRGTDSQVDLNRAGTPLLEIVSQPDLRSAADAKRYLEELRLLLTYLQVSDCNMQEGSLRCDANVNLHIQHEGETIATPIVEIKNLNSFRFTEMALEYEVARQLEEWKKTGRRLAKGEKETRGYDSVRNLTFAQRGKEEASDYRYFPDPDLVPVTVSDELLQKIRASQGEFPADRRRRIAAEHQLSGYDAGVIIDQGEVFANYFEEVAKSCGDGKQACNWITQDVLREMNERKLSIDQFPIRPPLLAELLSRINTKKITIKSAREVFLELLASPSEPPIQPSISNPHQHALHAPTEAYWITNTGVIDEIVKKKGLEIVSDAVQLETVIAAVLAKNAKAVADFRGGKQAAVGALIGQVMREIKGADPGTVRQMLIEKITSG